MPTPETFLDAAQWMGIGTLAFAVVTALAFLLTWGIRFRLVGITGFCAVLTVGLFGISFNPLSPTVVAGSVPYTTVFDSGASQIVIKVPLPLTDTALQATLQQAAQNLLKTSRLGIPGQSPRLRARTLLHTQPGGSELVYLGQLQVNPQGTPEMPWLIEIDAQRLAQANATVAGASDL